MSSATVLHLPTSEEAEVAKNSSRALAKYAHTDRLNLKINANGQTDDLVLPGFAINMLLDILTEMSKGNAVTVMPIHAELSTQQAAEILNVSRPYLVSLLEQGKIPFKKTGSHRRVLAKDVFDYQQTINAQRTKTLEELALQAQELNMGYE